MNPILRERVASVYCNERENDPGYRGRVYGGDSTRMPTPAERLREVLRLLRLNDAEFARRIGVSKSLVNRAMKGERAAGEASPTIVLAAFQTLGLRPEYWRSDGSPADFMGPPPTKAELIAASIDGTVSPAIQEEQRRIEAEERRFDLQIQAIRAQSQRTHATMIGAAGQLLPDGALKRFREYPAPNERVLGFWAEEEIATGGAGGANAEKRVLEWWTFALLSSALLPEPTPVADVDEEDSRDGG